MRLPHADALRFHDGRIGPVRTFVWLLVASASLIVLGGVVLAVVVSPARRETIVEILGILFSWPVAIAVLGISAGATFKEQLASYLGRMLKISGPWGAIEASPTQEAPPETKQEEADEQRELALTEQQEEELDSYIARLEESVRTGM